MTLCEVFAREDAGDADPTNPTRRQTMSAALDKIDAEILALVKIAAYNGGSITARGVRNAIGIEYRRAYRALERLARKGLFEVTNDAYGRKRWRIAEQQPLPSEHAPEPMALGYMQGRDAA